MYRIQFINFLEFRKRLLFTKNKNLVSFSSSKIQTLFYFKNRLNKITQEKEIFQKSENLGIFFTKKRKKKIKYLKSPQIHLRRKYFLSEK